MDKERKGKLVVKIGCVMAAITLWLYISNTQNPLVNYTIKKVPVHIKNADIISQNKLALTKQDNYYVDIKVQGRASEVYKAKAGDFNIIADLSGYIVRKGENRLPVEIEKMPSNLTVVNNGDLWVKLDIDEVVERTVSVLVNLKGNSSNDKVVKETITNPNEVKVLGPSKQVGLVDKVIGTVDISKVSQSKTVPVNVRPVDPSGEEVKGVKIEPSRVYATLGINITKEVPIKVDTVGTIANNFNLNGVEPSKDKVKISGEEKVIRNITFIKTEQINLNGLTSNSNKEVKLVIPRDIEVLGNIGAINVAIKITPKEVVPKEEPIPDSVKKVEKEFTSTINITNLSKDLIANIDKEKLNFKILGDEKVLNNLSESNFKAYVDLSKVKTEGQSSIKVELTLPKGVTLVSKEFTEVKVDVKKKQ
ncbi:CdaR family protein [Hathewaya histolytica]|uniref:Membrane associated protein n=1 Tax=Hathewaya histolytica TaxID=1498 RepID=A0A4U9QXC4_HATHI|nr:CdaR family protein [Hathewaya histolytica]VTQ83129.1 membrane associated protein [Hathewaya histolytica]